MIGTIPLAVGQTRETIDAFAECLGFARISDHVIWAPTRRFLEAARQEAYGTVVPSKDLFAHYRDLIGGLRMPPLKS